MNQKGVSFRFVSFRFALTALGNAEDASFYTALEAKVTAAFTGKSNRRERKKKKKNARFLKAVSYDETYVHDETRSFAKTGSGQASGKVREKGCLFRFARSGLLRPRGWCGTRPFFVLSKGCRGHAIIYLSVDTSKRPIHQETGSEHTRRKLRRKGVFVRWLHLPEYTPADCG